MPLSLDTIYRTILAAARERRFVSYGELATAHGVPWPKVRREVPRQLGELVQFCHEEGWPLLSAVVVPQTAVETGLLDGPAREGFLTAARELGHEIGDPEAFVRDQPERVFAWASEAPDSLGIEEAQEEQDPEGGPRFVRYFGPVLDALRALGGEAKPAQVRAWLVENVSWLRAETEALTRSGRRSFDGKVG